MIEIPDELVIEGVARAWQRTLEARPDFLDEIAAKIAGLQAEIMTPHEAARLLAVTEDTLSRNHKKWGLAKSIALGASNPRYYRSQILEALHSREIAPHRKASAIRVLDGKQKPGVQGKGVEAA